jgi:PTH1 family peptidyl-tRNA hydrolase
MLLIVGLGNPGSKYIGTRHNLGFEIVSSLAALCKVDFTQKDKLSSEIAFFSVENEKILFVKPLTYMNLSGSAVSLVQNYYKIQLSNIIVIHDEIDIDLGRVKSKIGGGSGGHNGIKSIDGAIGNDYYRVRVGVGRPKSEFDISNWILEKFSKDERVITDQVTKILIDKFQNIKKREIISIASS